MLGGDDVNYWSIYRSMGSAICCIYGFLQQEKEE